MSPIKPTVKTEIFPLLLLILTLAASFYFYNNFPDRIATHWNFEGQIDGYSSKAVGVFLLPLVILGLYLMFLVLPYLDPKKDRYQEFAKTYHLFKSLIIGFMFIMYIATGLANLGYPIDIGIVVPVLVGILFIIMGKYMGTIKPNWFVGIRTPWTMSSENVWHKTHRVGGWLFIAVGIVMLLMPLLPKWLALPIFIIAIGFATLGSFVYSYFLYRTEKK
ncbi:MAG: SdpI family protein [Candidatus Buchananbacteria bacterium]|nr:SdpI family protein [Candidatus Buchananbacteria bacterium]